MTNKIKLKKLQLMRSIKDSSFFIAYKKLITYKYEELTENEKFLLLKFAVIFLNYGTPELEKFGYRIILSYANLSDDYIPLYDISINKNYIPVANFIEEKYLNSNEYQENLYRLLMSTYQDNFKHKQNGIDIYFSAGQKRLYEFSKKDENFVIVAPTSYGKSELIIQKIENNLDKNVCILVPTKSLLAQTKKRLIENSIIQESQNKIITHPDMVNGELIDSFIAVMTQERLLRLLQKNASIKFDIVLIDEAHNLIENDSREVLSIQNLKILKKRNTNTKNYYFTPFLVEPKKLKVFKNEELLTDKIHEYIKVEKYFVFDLISDEKILKVYDQFLNDFLDIEIVENVHDSFGLIEKYAANKNIIYLNRPKHIEEFTTSIQRSIIINEKIRKVQKSLREFLHSDYDLIKALSKGVVYHHGGMPENVRLYVEDAFSNIDEIKYIITTSTLLQGVNIPAEKIFLLDTRKGRDNLNSAQFKNLSGRICRFNEVFNKETGDLKLLEPQIYVIKSKFSRIDANIEKFLKDRVKDNKVIVDKIDNPLIKQNLEDVTLTDVEQNIIREAEEYQENIEHGSSDLDNLRVVTSEIAMACFKNNIHDFDIFENEVQLEENYNNSKNLDSVDTPDKLVFLIAQIFLYRIKLKDELGDSFQRLENGKAKSFYAKLLAWRAAGISYSKMINNFVWYWDNIKDDLFIYVGTRWGEIESPYRDGFKKLYIDLTNKTKSQKINIAIIRIKEEQDFIDYKLMPYIEVLSDLGLIEQSFYDRVKYGTDNQFMIKLLKEGFSIELAKIVKNKYSDQITVLNDTVMVKRKIIEKMRCNNENELLIFELKFYI